MEQLFIETSDARLQLFRLCSPNLAQILACAVAPSVSSGQAIRCSREFTFF